MDIWFLSGFIILIIIVVIYLGTLFLLYLRQNPTQLQSQEAGGSSNALGKSIVTHSYIGRRGDMGNQIFQLASIIAAGSRSNASVVFPTRLSSLPIADLFDLTGFEWKDVDPDSTFYEYDNYEDIIIPSDGRIYDVSGYRQSYMYFEDSSDLIRSVFTPKSHILEAVTSAVPSQYITVHIRKGDYIKLIHTFPLLREFRRCQLDYYKKGILMLRKIYPDCPLLVCTDSPKWVSPLLSELDPKAVLAPTITNISPKYTDFVVLYHSLGVVMSNSTFSWWACYLNPGRPVFAPSPWWDPDGFIGTAMGLDGPYLHHPDWYLLDPDTGNLVKAPNSNSGKRIPDSSTCANSDTLNIYRLVRGLLL